MSTVSSYGRSMSQGTRRDRSRDAIPIMSRTRYHHHGLAVRLTCIGSCAAAMTFCYSAFEHLASNLCQYYVDCQCRRNLKSTACIRLRPDRDPIPVHILP